jgi:hypothetical protein
MAASSCARQIFSAAAQLQPAGKLHKKSLFQLQKFCYFAVRKNS